MLPTTIARGAVLAPPRKPQKNGAGAYHDAALSRKCLMLESPGRCTYPTTAENSTSGQRNTHGSHLHSPASSNTLRTRAAHLITTLLVPEGGGIAPAVTGGSSPRSRGRRPRPRPRPRGRGVLWVEQLLVLRRQSPDARSRVVWRGGTASSLAG